MNSISFQNCNHYSFPKFDEWIKRQIDQLAKQNQTAPLSASILLVASVFYIENELIGTSKNCCNQ